MTDWDDLRFFLALSERGTLSAAAKVLGVTQPTVGRRIAAFEARLGARLFLRSSNTWALSAVGRQVVAHARRMQEHALSAEALATGRDSGLDGRVRITAAEWMIRSVVGPALAPFIARNSSLSVELSADPRHLSLVKREADIALRASRFPHQEVFQREVASVRFGLYASDTYLSRYGMPDFARGCEGHVLVGMTEDLTTIVDVEWLAIVAPCARVAVVTNGREPMVTMAVAGIGITCLPRFLGDSTVGLRRLITPAPEPVRQLFVGVHRAARNTPRIRATLTFLTEALAHLRGALCPVVLEGHTRALA